MSYVAKTDWKHDDPVTEQDLNRWETGIKENTEKLGTVQEFALTTASGDAKESITNVNTATTVGLFLVGSTATGAPTTAVGLLYVWRRGSTHLLQEYWETGLNKRYHRTSTDNGATWTAWQTIANTDVATTSKDGLMSASDKTKLDGVATGANNYLHPATHPASMIVEDIDRRFISDSERIKWNGAYATIGDHTADGSIHLGSSEKIAVTELQNVSDSSWTTATLLNGWSTKFDRTPRFRRVGNMVQLSGGVGGGTTGDGTSVFVLPVGMRPSRTIVVPVIAAGTGAILNSNALINRMVITSAGNVTFSYGWNPEGWAIDVIIPL